MRLFDKENTAVSVKKAADYSNQYTDMTDAVMEDIPEDVDAHISGYIQNTKVQKRMNGHRFWLIFLGVLVLLLCLRLIIVPVAVIGKSMDPTLKDGSLLITKNASFNDELKYGDIVVFRNEDTENMMYIKRVEGLPGDVIQVKYGKLFRNGEPVEEKFPEMNEAGIYQEEMTLQAGEYFVLGDNRNHSTDSRFIGPVHRSDIMYVAYKK